jgi:hypothetical protein
MEVTMARNDSGNIYGLLNMPILRGKGKILDPNRRAHGPGKSLLMAQHYGMSPQSCHTKCALPDPTAVTS